MADTERTTADLQTLFADNASGAISPQDLRDFLVSAQMHGTSCWEDQQGDAINSQSNRHDLTIEVYRDTGHYMSHYRRDQDNHLSCKYQMSHEWSGTSATRLHVHCIPVATGAGNVVFQTKYVWGRVGYVLPASASWTTKLSTMSVASADVYKPVLHHLATCAVVTGCAASSVLYATVSRLGLTASADTYSASKTGGTAAANLALEFVDNHFTKKRAGTISEY